MYRIDVVKQAPSINLPPPCFAQELLPMENMFDRKVILISGVKEIFKITLENKSLLYLQKNRKHKDLRGAKRGREAMKENDITKV